MICFRIHFHGPFRIASGTAAPGVDSSVDSAALLPESSMKGVMRKAAADLGFAPSLVGEVFGTAAAGSAWAWSPVQFDSVDIGKRTRVKIDAERGTVERGALVIAHEAWATTADFDVLPMGRLDSDTLDRHRAVLVLSARAVRSVGASRNRGLGWVSIEARSGAEGVETATLLDLLGGGL